VQDEEQLVLHLEDEAFPESPQPTNCLPLSLRQRRFDAPQQKRANETHLLQRLPVDPSVQAFQVDHDIREFRHGGSFLLFRRPRCRKIALRDAGVA